MIVREVYVYSPLKCLYSPPICTCIFPAHRIPDAPGAAKSLKHKVEAALSARHSAEKVLRCWGSGAGLTYQDTKDSISRMLSEFKASGDIEEAARCLHALNVPFFHHEVKLEVYGEGEGCCCCCCCWNIIIIRCVFLGLL